MFERKERSGEQAGHRKLLGMLVFLLGMSVIGGCGTTPTTTASTPASLPARIQPTVENQPFHATAQTFDGDFSITLDITPGRSGPNKFIALVMSAHTNKPATHIMITLYTTMQDMAMGTDSVALRAVGNGQFSATSNVLSMGGHWTIGITIQTADHVVHKAGVSLVTSS